MKKSLVFSFLILFVLSTSAFAGLNDPKKESEKPAVSSPKENKLSDEELSRMTRRVEIDNLGNSNSSIKGKNDLRKNPNAAQEVVVYENRHHGGYFWYGGGSFLLVVLLVIILV